MQDLRVTGIQFSIYWENKEANLSHLAQVLETAEPTDVIVLPEMFNSGFSMEAKKLAEPQQGRTLEWMKEQAARRNAAICGSYVVGSERGYFNRFHWVNPDSSYFTYDKKHLFSLAGEDKVYTPGTERVEIEFRGWRIRPMVCYDLRFPVWCANDKPPFDLLIFVANWPDRRIHHWDHLLPARAIENQAFVFAVNRVGADGNGIVHSGHSSVFAPDGELLQFHKATEIVFTEVLQAERIDTFRNYLSALNDAERYRIEQG
ncbi:MAG: amidohydrolase [Flavobacteriales bacterium]|nr:amidohydrolase [Flavobacteriales bacterium]